MGETLSFLDIGGETGGFNNAFQKSQDLYNKQSNILLKQSPLIKHKVDYLNGIKEEKHDNYIVATEKQKNQTLTEKNIFLNEVNERKRNTVNTYKDVQNLADFSRLIEKENDEGMKTLEEILGTENLYKCVLLTIAGTASEVGKGMFDVLKIGEGIAEGVLC